MTLRRVLFWCHLAAGVLAGIVILVMCVTGVLLTYEKQIILWADTRDLEIAAPPAATRVPLGVVVASVAEGRPDAVASTVTVRNDAAAPVAVVAGGRVFYVNPYTGQLLGNGAPAVRQFFRSVTEWHRYLAASGEQRPRGRAVTGAANLAFLFIVASGVVMWWPKVWSWRQVRPTLLFTGRLRGKARDFNWHNVLGVWSAAPLFFIVLGSTVISYPWAGNLVYRLAGEAPPAPVRPANASGAGRAAASAHGLDALLARAQRQVEDWRVITFRVDGPADAPVAFTIDSGTGGQPQRKGTLTLSRADAQLAKWEPFAALTTGRQLRSWLRFVHTGEFYGMAGQTIAGLASAAGAVLVFTGISLAMRRFLGWIGRRRNGARGDAGITRAA